MGMWDQMGFYELFQLSFLLLKSLQKPESTDWILSGAFKNLKKVYKKKLPCLKTVPDVASHYIQIPIFSHYI